MTPIGSKKVTASEAGLSRQDQVPIVLRAIENKGGVAQMRDIYQDMKEHIGQNLSKQGKASLREVVNRYMKNLGYVTKNRDRSGWRITPKGRKMVGPVDIETYEGDVVEIDALIQANRLRIGCIDTDEKLALSRRRKGQQRLRELTLTNYFSTCAFCDVSDSNLLVTSHIVGWAEDPDIRGHLSNIICLCSFHDVLFEKGFFSLTDDLIILKKHCHASHFIELLLKNTKQFRKPVKYPPQPEYLLKHRLRCGFK